MRLAIPLLLPVALVAGGCVPVFPMPMTATQFAQANSGAALVAYLGQPDAGPSVCDLANRGPHLTLVNAETLELLGDGLREGRVKPELWRRCIEALLKGLQRPEAVGLMDVMGTTYRALLRDGDFEQNPLLQKRLAVLHEMFLERPNGLSAHPALMDGWLSELDQAIERERLGPIAMTYGKDLLATVDLEQGLWRGKPVREAALDALQAMGNEKLLRRFAARLPDPAMRQQALRRIVRLHIAASQFPEVRNNARTVEDIVIKLGRYPVSPVQFAPRSASLDATRIPIRGVLVRQQILKQTVTLLGYGGDRPGVSVLPELSLRGALQIELAGISRPVTLCGPAKDVDPTPCVAAEEVKLDNPMAYLDQDGAFHFVEHVAMRDAVVLTQGGGNFLLPVSVARHPLLTLNWGLWFEKPENLVLSGGPPGDEGPNLGVSVDNRNANRLVYTVGAGGASYLAVVEMAEAQGFHVVSAGRQGPSGARGQRGYDGRRGSDGQNASCPSTAASPGAPGENGGPGGLAGPGGNGGRGGDITVQVHCGSHPCGAILDLLRLTVYSQGGAAGFGGSGGAGGTGGSGGRGGSSVTCYANGQSYSIAAASDGARGLDGRRGPDGPPGLPAPPGRVGFRTGP